jgi:sulfate/thiosulfate-binding protein
MHSIRTSIVAAAVALVALSVAACGSSNSSAGTLALVAYSTPKEAYAQIIPAFQKTAAGKGVDFTQSYGNSGDQARAIISGLDADIAALSLEPDITKLVKEGKVPAGWRSATDTKGIVTRSVVVIAVRKGNPKKIRSWADLVRPGVSVLTPNPFTSGGARWNVMAAYGAQIAQGSSEAQATAYLQQLFKHVKVQDKSAREALQSFTGGAGDALISYENEAITARQKGEAIDYVVPDRTILIENPIAATSDAGAKAKAFIDYATSKPAQMIFASKGYRSIIPSLVDKRTFPDPPGLFRITRFGGWDAVMKKFFDPDNSVMQRIEKGLGVGTG